MLHNNPLVSSSIFVSKKNKHKRVDVSGGEDAFGTQAFGSLNFSTPLPPGPPKPTNAEPNKSRSHSDKPKTRGGRLDVKREKSGRGGKTVTVIYSFPGMDERMRKEILSLLKKRLATGGTISAGNVEIQGDFSEKVVEILKKERFQAVKAGG